MSLAPYTITAVPGAQALQALAAVVDAHGRSFPDDAIDVVMVTVPAGTGRNMMRAVEQTLQSSS